MAPLEKLALVLAAVLMPANAAPVRRSGGSHSPVAGAAPVALSRGKVVKTDLTMPADFTLAFDIHPTGTERDWASIVHYTDGGNGNRVPGIWFWPGTTKLHVVVGPNNHHINPDHSLPLNQWSSVRVQLAGATAKITINGRDFDYTGLPIRPAVTVGVTLYAADPWYPAARASIRAHSSESMFPLVEVEYLNPAAKLLPHQPGQQLIDLAAAAAAARAGTTGRNRRQATATFDVELNWITPKSAAQEAVFEAAALVWETLLSGVTATGHPGKVVIDVGIEDIDGPGKILGYAGPRSAISGMSSSGIMVFDQADMHKLEKENTMDDVAMHEMAHVFGFGTLWEQRNGVYTRGSGQYKGDAGLAVFRREVGPEQISHIPVELDGGSGTANGHWDENHGDAGNGGSYNRRDHYELMTGYLDGESYLSAFTVASMGDLGFKPAACFENSDCDAGETCDPFPGCSDPTKCWLPNICRPVEGHVSTDAGSSVVFVGKGVCTSGDGAWPQRNYMKDRGLYGCKTECERRGNCIGYTTYPGRASSDCYFFTDAEDVKEVTSSTKNEGQSGWYDGMDCYSYTQPGAPVHRLVGKGMCTDNSGRWPQRNYMKDRGLYGCQAECERRGNCIGYTTYPGRASSDCYFFTDAEDVKEVGSSTESHGGGGWYHGMDCYAVSR